MKVLWGKVFAPRVGELFGPSAPRFTWSGEILAGVSVGLIALPLALALGIASVPAGVETPAPAPALGVITAIVGGFLVSLLGGSRVQIGGPTAAFVPIVLFVVTEHGYSGLLIATMMAGVILILLGLTRMGSLIKFIPWPVTSGFTTGIAVSIILTQIPDLAGWKTAGPMPRDLVEKIPWLVSHAGLTETRALLVALAALGLMMIWPRLRIGFLPGSLVAMAATAFGVWVAGWGDGGLIQTVGGKFGSGAVPSGIPWPSFPEGGFGRLRDLVAPATAIALLGAIESLLSAVVADGLSGDRHDSNTELVAQGIANVVCPFFGGLPVTGAIARTSANITHGGRTPLAGMAHAGTLLVIMLLASRLASGVPMAALSAVLMMVAFRMGEWHELARLGRMPRSDALVLVTTFGLTVAFDLVVAVEVGMVLAAFLFIRRIAETTEVSRVTDEDMLERPEHVAQGKEIPEGVVVYRIFGPFLFGAAEKMEHALARLDEIPRVLILRLNLVTALDTTGLNALENVVEWMRSRKGVVLLSGIHQQPLAMLRKAGFIGTVGRENFCATFDDALLRAQELVGGTPRERGGDRAARGPEDGAPTRTRP